MKQKLYDRTNTKTEPIYATFWEAFKHFPKGLSEGSHNPPSNSGPAAAAIISAGIGCLMMMVTHHWSETSQAVDKIVLAIGSWIPGSHNPDKMWGNIGSYAGKETMLLISWLFSWIVLYWLWKNQNIKAKTVFLWMFILFVISTAMSWHPLFPYLPLL